MPTLADAGLPMIFLQLPAMLFGLLPVIVAEFVVARKMLNLDPKKTSMALIASNLASTLVGFPLVWGLLLIVQLLVGGGYAYGLRTFWTRAYAVTVQAPWLIPYEGNLKWMIPIAGLYLLIPAFFTSVYLERQICFKFWRDQDRARVRKFSWMAHFASYSVLIVIASIYYGIVLKRG